MRQVLLVAGLLAVCSVGVRGQEPDGTDINKAIPIFFGQVATDIGDWQVAKVKVYKFTVARGQKFTAAATTMTNPDWRIRLAGPSAAAKNVNALTSNDILDIEGYTGSRGITGEYLAPAAGTYFVILDFGTGSRGVNYSLQVTTEGTPIAVPNPATAGCLTGKVDSILFSLQRIAAGLPDEVTIGGQRACAGCTVKPPLYTEITSRLEGALRSGVNVEACYDSAGSIFQLKLLRQ